MTEVAKGWKEKRSDKNERITERILKVASRFLVLHCRVTYADCQAFRVK